MPKIDTETRTGNDPQNPVQGATGIDQVKPLSELAKDAERIDAGGSPGAPGAVEVIAPDTRADDIFSLLELARNMAAPFAEMAWLKPGQTAEIWSNERLKAIAAPLVVIMDRHGIGMGEAMDKMGPYIALIAGFAGPAMATWQAIKINAVELQGQGSGQQQPA